MDQDWRIKTFTIPWKALKYDILTTVSLIWVHSDGRDVFGDTLEDISYIFYFHSPQVDPVLQTTIFMSRWCLAVKVGKQA